MKRTNDFAPADRYVYDFRLCTVANGYAQIDSDQDTSYFGTWANPTTRVIISYCEGDISIAQCDNDAEFVEELQRINAWNVENGYRPIGIDPGANLHAPVARAFAALQLSNDPFERYVKASSPPA